jgi:hypothetical protein
LADELARAAEASLFHPSIVEPIAAGVQGTVAYRAEEYVAAESLDVAMRHYAPAALDKALPFITQLAGAIDFARASKVGHGALHPRDIFVTPDEARATGFGVVEALERVGLRAPVRRPYTAPERIAGVTWTTSADVFSLAAIAFELLTGRRPSGTGSEIGSLNGAELGKAGSAIHAVLARAMDDRPDHRYQGALEFAAALEVASRGEHPTGAATEVAAVAGMLRDDEAPPGPVELEAGAPRSAAPTIAASLATDAEQAVAQDQEEEDVAAEREEDESHVVLMKEEVSAAADEEELYSADDPEAEADRVLDTTESEPADLPLVREEREEEDARDEPEFPRTVAKFPGSKRADPLGVSAAAPPLDPVEPPRPRVSLLETTEAEARYGPAPRPGYPSIFDSTEAPGGVAAVAPEKQPIVFPVAVGVLIGLLVGFGAGYGVGARDWRLFTSSPPAADAQTPPEAKPFSDQAVDAPPPAAAVQPGAPPRSAPEPQPDTRPAAPPAPAPPPRATAGTLEIRSAPAGAGVTINGDWKGRTPLVLEQQPFARYAIRVVQPGYVVARENVTLSAAEPDATVSVRLQRQPTAATTGRSEPDAQPRESVALTGTLFVDSRPRGARVFLDNRPVGTTPLSLPEVPIGSHVVRFELPDHRPWSTTTRVVAGQTARVTGSMERIQ